MIRHARRAIVHGLAGVLGAVLVALALVLWRLSGGPISLAPLSPQLAEALSGQAAGYSFAFDDTVLVLGEWPRALDIRVTRVRIVDDAGNLLLVAPEVGIGLSLRQLLVGQIVPVSLVVERPLLRVVRRADGRVTIGGSETAGASTDTAAGDAGWRTILADLGPNPDPRRPLARLDRVAISDGAVAFEDEALGIAWRADALDLAIDRVDDGVALKAAARLPFGDPTAHMDASLMARRDVPELALTVRFGGVRPAKLATLTSGLAPLAGVDLAFGGVVNARLDDGMNVIAADIEAWSGPGTVDPGGVLGAPREVKGITVRAHTEGGPNTVVVDSFELDVGAGGLDGTAHLIDLDHNGVVDLQATATGITIADVLGFWPTDLGVGPRTWLAENVLAGTVRTGTIGLVAEISALGRDESPLHGLSLALDVTDGVVVYKAPLPPVEGVIGKVVLAEYALKVDGLSGRSAGLTVSDGAVAMASLDGNQGLTVDVALAGPVDAALRLASEPSLGLGGVADLAAQGVGGQATGTIAVILPRLNDLKRDDVAVTAAAKLERVTMAEAASGLAVTDGTLDLVVEGVTAKADGTVVLAGVPLAASLGADMAGGGLRATLAGRLDDAARAALGLPALAWLTGPIDARLTVAESGGGTRLEAEADLTGASIALAEAGWTKAAGEPGTAAAAWVTTPDGATNVESLTVAAGGLVFDGAGAFGADGAEGRVEARRLALGVNEAAGTLAWSPAGYDVALQARALDLGPFLDTLTGESGEDEPLPPFRLAGSIDALYLRPGTALTGVTIDTDFADDRFARLAFTGATASGAPMVMAIQPVNGQRTFTVDAADAGDVLRLFDVFDNVMGGRLEISATIDDANPARPATGRMVMSDFKVRDAPILGKILALGSFTTISALLQGEGVPFSKANIPFVKTDGLITIGKARAWGGSLGLNGEGTIDIAANVIDLRGTVVPAYTINTVLGEVPILGKLLVGGEGEGLFAATYAVKGPLDNPDVLVNPLATLAPGFLRELFEFPEGTVQPPPPAETGTGEQQR
jgi:hypothetical protein